MQRWTLSTLLALAVLAVAAGPSLACVNDSSSSRQESQFQAGYSGGDSYLEQIGSVAQPVLIGFSVAALAGAVWIGLRAIRTLATGAGSAGDEMQL